MKREQGKVARRYVIAGRVQGVGFRFFAERVARELGVCGYVRNLETGSVEVLAQASEPTLEEFKHHLSRGPLGARVSVIEESEESVDENYTRFLIEP